jgi:hypothetical protein
MPERIVEQAGHRKVRDDEQARERRAPSLARVEERESPLNLVPVACMHLLTPLPLRRR